MKSFITLLGTSLMLVAIVFINANSLVAFANTVYKQTSNEPFLFIVNSSGSATVGQTHTVEIHLANNSTSLNVLETELWFDPAVFEIQSVDIISPLCRQELQIEKAVNNADGILYFACGNYVPFSGEETILARIELTPLTAATSAITFGPRTSLYAHDGLGTNVPKQTFGVVSIVNEVAA